MSGFKISYRRWWNMLFPKRRKALKDIEKYINESFEKSHDDLVKIYQDLAIYGRAASTIDSDGHLRHVPFGRKSE
jgi:hypothetical protein